MLRTVSNKHEQTIEIHQKADSSTLEIELSRDWYDYRYVYVYVYV